MNAPPTITRPPSVDDLKSGRWVLVYSGARAFMGHAVSEDRESGTISLAPAFDFVSMLGVDQARGTATRTQLILPIEMVGAKRVQVRPDALVRLSDFDELEAIAAKIGIAMGVQPREAGAPRILIPGSSRPQ
jgi:hypothetical protein